MAVVEHLLLAIPVNPSLITKMIVCAAIRGKKSTLIHVPRIYQKIFIYNGENKNVNTNRKNTFIISYSGNPNDTYLAVVAQRIS